MRIIHWECNPDNYLDYEDLSYCRIGLFFDNDLGKEIGIYIRFNILLTKDENAFVNCIAEEIYLRNIGEKITTDHIEMIAGLSAKLNLGPLFADRLDLYDLREVPLPTIYFDNDEINLVAQKWNALH